MKKIKKLLVVLCALALVFGIANFNANAATGTGASGDPVTFTRQDKMGAGWHTIAAGQTLYCQTDELAGMVMVIDNATGLEVVTSAGTYEADAYGTIKAPIPAKTSMNPVSLQINNTGSEDTMIYINFEAPEGTIDNPKSLDDISTFTTVLEPGNYDGYTYSWVADKAGTLTLNGNFTGTEAVALSNKTQSISNDIAYADEDGFPVSIKVAPGDEVLIGVLFYDGAAGTITLNGTFTEATGTSEVDSIYVTEDFTKTIAADTTVYYAASNLAGMVMTVEGENIAIIYDSEEVAVSQDGKAVFTLPNENPAFFQIKNKGTEAVDVEVSFAIALGDEENPLIVETPLVFEDEITGYYYMTFIAPENGTFTFTIVEGLDELEAVNLYHVEGDKYYNSEDFEEGENAHVVSVEEGDTIKITISTPYDWDTFKYDTVNVVFEVSFVDELTEILVGEISQMEKGETAIVGVQEDGTIAVEILEAAAAKDVVLKIQTSTYTWLIDGATIGANIAPVDLDVTIGGNTVVPANVLSTVEKENYVALSLAHNGKFGFDATLSFKIDAKYAGKEATLYYYNTTTGKLENQGKVVVGKNGEVAYDFEHASDYIIAINEPTKTESSDTGEANYVAIVGMFLLAGAGLFVLRRKMR